MNARIRDLFRTACPDTVSSSGVTAGNMSVSYSNSNHLALVPHDMTLMFIIPLSLFHTDGLTVSSYLVYYTDPGKPETHTANAELT